MFFTKHKMTKYFVSPTGSNAEDGLTKDKAFASLSKAAQVLKSGDFVEVAGGLYKEQKPIVISGISSFLIGAAAGEIPVLEFAVESYNGFDIRNCSNFTISFIELKGAADKLTYEGALAASTTHTNKYSVNGMHIEKCYFFTIQGCRVSEFPGGGIACVECDQAKVDRCVVRSCTKYSPYGTQGITFLNAINFQGGEPNTERLTATNNICYDNYNLIPWNLGGGNQKLNEGAGLYSDTTKESKAKVPYTGTVRFENNLTVFNGAAGLHALNSAPISIVGNFIGTNTRNLNRGEIQLTNLPSAIVKKNLFCLAEADKDYLNCSGIPSLQVSENTIRGSAKATTFRNPGMVIENNTFV